MIRLLIDGQEVTPSADFSSTIYQENPRYSKNGQYTYDLILSLKNFNNARIYKHIDRINIKKGIQYKRSAVLWVDNRIILNGTEIIIGFGDSEVKIQLASGNSELNFLIGSEQKLRDLDLGKAYVYGDLSYEEKAKQVYKDLQKGYPERDFQFLPYCVDENEIIKVDGVFPKVGNSFYLKPNPDNPNNAIMEYNPFMSGSVPQPYLCFIIKKVLESLGYTLAFNAIADHPVLSQTYIVHGFRTTYFAKMLPSWTVEEFFTELENWLDCSFIINEFNKSVRLLFNYQADQESLGLKTITLTVKDEYNVETEPENKLTVQNANIGYLLGNEIYYGFMDLGREIKERATLWFDPWGINSLLSDLNTIIDVFKFIFTVADVYGEEFIAFDTGETRTLRKVDSFRPKYNNSNSTDLDIEFKIIPAAMNYGYQAVLHVWYPTYWIQIPIAGDADPLEETDDTDYDPDNEPINIQSVIEGDSSIDSNKTYNQMRVAMYTGLQNLEERTTHSLFSSVKYPIPYVEALAEYFPDTKKIRFFGQEGLNPFRLSYLKSEIYDKANSPDTTKPYKYSFELKDDFDIRSTFIIRNKEFVCLKVERTVTINGFGKFAIGYFYPKEKNKEA